ncbi:MAG: MoaF N-terminal domain-containing protein [Gemmatimonadetes bacterium]|nr:MoaF N-terminal domain-containing protein [Gemmatimonadota bacterium]
MLYSNFVELTRFGGELSFCGPSDYIKINDEQYIYSRVECEFSGTMTLYALDLFSLKQVGMRLGFNEADALDYYLFAGSGEMVGQISRFERFDDAGDTIALGNRPAPTRKGERPVYRPLLTNPAMTKEEVEAAVAKNTVVFDPRNAMAGNRLPTSGFLVGKQLTLRYDDGGPVLDYRFDELQKLRWRRGGEARWREERYEAWEPAEGVIMFGHLLSGTPRHDSAAVVIDFDNGLTSCVQGMLGTPYMANEASRKTWFGVGRDGGADAACSPTMRKCSLPAACSSGRTASAVCMSGISDGRSGKHGTSRHTRSCRRGCPSRMPSRSRRTAAPRRPGSTAPCRPRPPSRRAVRWWTWPSSRAGASYSGWKAACSSKPV